VLRRLLLLSAILATALGVIPAAAQDAAAGPVVVADIRGPLEQRGLDFLTDVVRSEDAQLIVLKIDNPGVASGDPSELFDAIETSATPVVAWVGPDGAKAYGGVVQVLEKVTVAGAAPGGRIGYRTPTVAGDPPPAVAELSSINAAEVVVADESTIDLISIVEPTIGQFIAALDGRAIATELGEVTLETAVETTLEDGTVATVSSVEVRFRKPTLLTRFLRLGVRPDAAFFFLLAGLAAAAFEFYAAGAGVAAGVALLSLFLAGYGLATLPMNWLAVTAAVVGLGLYTWDFQRHELGVRSIAGTVLMLWGGVAFTNGAPQFGTSLVGVGLTVVGIMLFYLFAMTTIVRSRFGTPTIGREHLVGMTGIVESQLHPDGVVMIDGAKWRARAPRAAAVERGTPIEVLGVEGITLQVAPLGDDG
jgi:membrane-bound serine protease (ClpP class)